MAAHSSGVLLDTPHGKRSTPPRAETDGSIDAYRLLAGQTVNANSIFGFKSMLVAQPAFLQRFSPACGSCKHRLRPRENAPCRVCVCARARMRACAQAAVHAWRHEGGVLVQRSPAPGPACVHSITELVDSRFSIRAKPTRPDPDPQPPPLCLPPSCMRVGGQRAGRTTAARADARTQACARLAPFNSEARSRARAPTRRPIREFQACL